MDTFDAILSTIPKLEATKKVSKPAIIIVGKSGAGASTLAKKITQELGLHLISAASIHENIAGVLGTAQEEVFTRLYIVPFPISKWKSGGQFNLLKSR